MEGKFEDIMSAIREGILNNATKHGLWSQTSCVYLPALLPINIVMLGKFLTSSPYFHFLIFKIEILYWVIYMRFK